MLNNKIFKEIFFNINMKKMKINFNISNRAIYSILTIMIVVLAGAAVYATSHVSHTWGEITGVPATLSDGSIAWSELTGVPAGFADGVDDAGLWQGTGDIYYNGGKVGIGTDTPSAKLDVAGDLNVAGVSTTGSIAASSLELGGVTFPQIPNGTTLVWSPSTEDTTTVTQSNSAWTSFFMSCQFLSEDSCDSDVFAAYSCPLQDISSCTDVKDFTISDESGGEIVCIWKERTVSCVTQTQTTTTYTLKAQ